MRMNDVESALVDVHVGDMDGHIALKAQLVQEFVPARARNYPPIEEDVYVLLVLRDWRILHQDMHVCKVNEDDLRPYDIKLTLYV